MSIRAHPWLIIFPPFSAQGILIWAQVVGIVVNYISVFPCPSVLVGGWYISHWETSFRCYGLTTELHWPTLNQGHIYRVSVPVRARRWLVYPPLRDIFLRYGLTTELHWPTLNQGYISCFRVPPCSSVVGTPPPTHPIAFDTFPIHTRYIPDTYPIHTYIPWILHEYPAYTPWIPLPYEKRNVKICLT